MTPENGWNLGSDTPGDSIRSRKGTGSYRRNDGVNLSHGRAKAKGPRLSNPSERS